MKSTKILTLLLSIFILASCGTSHDVVDGGLFQKRKYNKGYHVSKKTKVSSTNGGDKAEVAFNSTIEKVDPKLNEISTDPIDNSHIIVEELDQSEIESTTVQDNKNQSTHFKSKISITKTNLPSIGTRKLNAPATNGSAFKPSSEIFGLKEVAMDGMTILLIILAILIPPLAVGLYEGITSRFWIDLLLALIGWGLGWFLLGPQLAWVAGLAAVIYALLIVLGAI